MSGNIYVVRKTVYCCVLFGATPVFSGIIFLWCITLRYYTVITVIFRYYAVSIHDTGNRSMGRSAPKSRGNVREFQARGDWSPCLTLCTSIFEGLYLPISKVGLFQGIRQFLLGDLPGTSHDLLILVGIKPWLTYWGSVGFATDPWQLLEQFNVMYRPFVPLPFVVRVAWQKLNSLLVGDIFTFKPAFATLSSWNRAV